MQASNAAVELIKQFEGFVSKSYLDLVGIPTIGFGHRVLKGETFPPNGITEDEATTLLQSDLKIVDDALTRLITVEISQNQYDAVADFCFNLGQGRLASSTLLRDINNSDFDLAAGEFEKWCFAGGVKNAGLARRRAAEEALFVS